ncbi:uncharacterized protein [Diadema antillarum]|uniref:uncharacterized protein n=1 Tax=Diadema antillarum TaxID=105358 RepID=UPI003A8A1849
MDGAGGGHCGPNQKILQLQRALSGGFGFSLMGGRGTGFPPVICDILSDSPASECDGMQVGDVILEINNEAMENKTTKEVVTALMKSPDDLILRVREDTAIRNRVVRFLAPLDMTSGFNQQRQKSVTVTSTKPQSDKLEISKVRNNSYVGSSNEVNEDIADSPSKDITKLDSSQDPSEHFCATSSNAVNANNSPVSARLVQSRVLQKKISNPGKLSQSQEEQQGSSCPSMQGNSVDASTIREQLTNEAISNSCSTDSMTLEAFVGQKLTTTALIHREDSLLAASRLSEEKGRSDTDNDVGASRHERDLYDEGFPPKTVNDIHSSVQFTQPEVIMNGVGQRELVRITTAQFPTTHNHSQEVRTRLENAANTCASSHSISTDSAFSSATPVVKVTATSSNIEPIKSTVTAVTVTSSKETQETSKPKLSTNAIGIQTNPSDLEPRKGSGDLNGVEESPVSGHSSAISDSFGSGKSPTAAVLTNSTASSSTDDAEFPDMDSLESALHENPKNLDLPSAKRLAKRLYELDGFKREDVSIHLSKRNEFCKLVAKEYLEYFDFTADRLDEALRDFLQCVTIVGESQERERVLAHFSRRFFDCNPGVLESSDAAHSLTCAVMLLNTDLHGQNISKKMSLNAFVSNLDGMNDGKNFQRNMLKGLYHAIKSRPLEFNTDDDDDDKSDISSIGRGSKKLSRNGTLASNPLLQVENDPNAPVYIQSYIMRKVIMDPEGKKTPKGKRGWKMYFATLKGLLLFLHKSEVAKEANFHQPKYIMSLHHAFASKSNQYDKKPNVFCLRLANWQDYLIQCLSAEDMQRWMHAVNLAAAVHSSPPLPAAVGSQVGFKRPLLPSSATKLDSARQLVSHDDKVESLERELEDHRNYPPDKKTKAKIVKDYKAKDEYLEFEVTRFKTYIYLLRSQPLSSLPPRTASNSPYLPPSESAKKTTPTPPPKFASSPSSSSSSSSSSPSPSSPSLSSPSSSSPSPLPDKRKFFQSPAPSSASHEAPSEGQSAPSKPSLHATSTSGTSGHADPPQEAPPAMRDNSNKVHRSFSDRYSYRMAIYNSSKMN